MQPTRLNQIALLATCAALAAALVPPSAPAAEQHYPAEALRPNHAAFTFCQNLLSKLKAGHTHPRCLPSGLLVMPSDEFNICVREQRRVDDQVAPSRVYYQAFDQCPVADLFTTYFCSPQCYQWAYSESLHGTGVPPNEQSLQNLHTCPRFYQWTGGNGRTGIHFSATARACFATPLELRDMTDGRSYRTDQERTALRDEVEKYLKMMDAV
jgi:hypothetical protein